MGFHSVADISDFLFDEHGRRKYLSSAERKRFLLAAEEAELAIQAFCMTMAYTGCRISEALALTFANLDIETGRIVIRTLKRRKRVYRAIPIPPALVAVLTELAAKRRVGKRLWPWCRQTGWRKITAVMAHARIAGPHASPKGLRHGFGIAAAAANIPPGLIQRWMGHARLETTVLYQHVVGLEERAFAERLWP